MTFYEARMKLVLKEDKDSINTILNSNYQKDDAATVKPNENNVGTESVN